MQARRQKYSYVGIKTYYWTNQEQNWLNDVDKAASVAELNVITVCPNATLFPFHTFNTSRIKSVNEKKLFKLRINTEHKYFYINTDEVTTWALINKIADSNPLLYIDHCRLCHIYWHDW